MVYSLHFVVIRFLDNFHRQIYCKWSPTSYHVHDSNYEIQQQSVAIKIYINIYIYIYIFFFEKQIDLYFVICESEFPC